MYKIFFVILFANLLYGCSHVKTKTYRNDAIAQAVQSGFQKKSYDTSYFLLTTYQRLSAHPKEIHVYIEGDGNSWKTRYQLSDNPTPKQPLALLLAIHDSHPDVCYIARPCQYTPITEDTHSLNGTPHFVSSLSEDTHPNQEVVTKDTHLKLRLWDNYCQPIYWSSHRYAPEVIQSTMDVLDALQKSYGDIPFKLIGFSGGAAVATIVASQRKDVLALVTVAGDLNHEALNHFHRTSPLTGSLNPIKYASKLTKLPQHHLIGRKDRIIPVWLSQEFGKEVNKSSKHEWVSFENEWVSSDKNKWVSHEIENGCVKISQLDGVSHHKGWVERWPEIVSQQISCKV